MSYNMPNNWGHYSAPRRKRNKYKVIGIYVLISALIQLSTLWGADAFLKSDSGIDLEPVKVITVKETDLKLIPPPSEPKMMTISSDGTQVAFVDGDQIKIHDLKDGSEVTGIELKGETPGALEWLPDRNRLIYALIDKKIITENTKAPLKTPSGNVKDEAYSTDKYRDETDSTPKEGFQIDIYGIEESQSPEPVLIKSLKESGKMPDQVQLNMSTYTNLLYIHWKQGNNAHLAQVDIMQRIKDFTLPRGEVNKLIISQKDGTLWCETLEDGSASIYKYDKNRWRLQNQLDGYRLLGITPDEQLAVALDQKGETKEVLLANGEGDLTPRWAFTKTLTIDNITILSDGRLLYRDQDRIVVHAQQLGEGSVYKLGSDAGVSADGKTAVLWQPDTGVLKVMQETIETKQENK